jgi:predicted MPP superfamily phosphohydrolase
MIEKELLRVKIFLLFIIILYIVEIFLLIRLIFFRNGKKIFFSKFSTVIHILSITGILCFLYGYFIEPHMIEIKKVDIRTEKLKKISLKVVQISDLHCRKHEGNEKKLPSIINPLEADVIVFTGDAINEPAGIPHFKKSLKSLKAKTGKFAVYGNIESWYFSDLELLKDTGFKLLNNESIKLSKDGEFFYISGIDYGSEENIPSIMKKIESSSLNIFLYHTPDLIENVSSEKVDLYLCGHTHGGQVRLPFYGSLITLSIHGKKYDMGEYKVGNTSVYVNRGLGTEGGSVPPVRFLCKPEITVFSITPAR